VNKAPKLTASTALDPVACGPATNAEYELVEWLFADKCGTMPRTTSERIGVPAHKISMAKQTAMIAINDSTNASITRIPSRVSQSRSSVSAVSSTPVSSGMWNSRFKAMAAPKR